MSEPKRILHVCGSSPDIGGIRAFIIHLHRNIDRGKVQFDYLRTSNNKYDYYDEEILTLGGKIYKIADRKPNYIKHISDLNKFFKANPKYDTIHIHVSNNIPIHLLINIAKKPETNKIIYHSHSNRSDRHVLNSIINFFYQPSIKKYATHYFACSDLAADFLFGKYIDNSKITIINNAIDTDKFIYNPQVRDKIHNEFNISENFLIGHVGRFSKAKNHEFLIDIFAEVCKENNNSILMLVGEGPMRPEIEKKVAELNLSDKVIFTGNRSDVNELMQAMDVLLLPSLNEGLGIVLIEAQASGLHSITSAEVVPKLAKITDLLEYIPLEKPARYWAEQVLQYAGGYERKNMQDELKKAGFDIKDLAKWFEDFYVGM